jgi:hypothetical protein
MNRVTMLCAQPNVRAEVTIRHDLHSDGLRTDRRLPKWSQASRKKVERQSPAWQVLENEEVLNVQ